MRSIVRMFLGLSLTASAAAPLAAQAGTIRGTISDSAGPGLANAALTVEGTALRGVSGTGGAYEIRGVPAGTYTVRVRLIGYRSQSAEVTVPQADKVTRDFTLLRSPVQLAPIDVVVGSRARHTAEEELAVPVDIFPAEELQRQGSTETSIILQSRLAIRQLPAAERHRRRRHHPAVHASRVEPRPDPGAGERLAPAPDGGGQHLQLRHARGIERGGPQRHPRQRAGPDRSPPRWGLRPVRLRRHRRRGEPGAQGRRVHALRER